jgi:hypothetical protein
VVGASTHPPQRGRRRVESGARTMARGII